jgi:hypothetical protein
MRRGLSPRRDFACWPHAGWPCGRPEITPGCLIRSRSVLNHRLNNFPPPSSTKDAGNLQVPPKNERVELEMKIMKYRLQALGESDLATIERLEILIAKLEQKLREIDE